ncbi:Protein PHYLLO, chloroplastic [Capsicum baccatum]|uniref:Protein PHYLLO, chloroplastic n=1 Tax=Capsicum baccatum TaxID=33114 RepID=A0A2G2WS55_CAPBA|nr:Protein PHYLLO, chloroplastic [Capsicum baccatum]
MYCFVRPSPSLDPLAFLSPIPRQNSGKLKFSFVIYYKQVAPLEVHQENLLDVEEQLQFLIYVLEGVTIDHSLPLLKGSFSHWLWQSLGIQPTSMFPSVRFGLEMAVLNAIAAREGSSLLNVLCGQTEEATGSSLDVKVCALLESNGGPNEMALVATTLVKEGFTVIKLKVARQADPTVDIAIIKEVRKKVGWEVELRADANQRWNYDEAVKFGLSVKDSGLQYIEEPVNDEDDIIKFCEETGLPVALDETINSIRKNHLIVLAKYTHPMIVAFVIKPSVVGGFENAALLARWAHQQGKMAVISATFESSLGLSALTLFSRYVDLLKLDTGRILNKEENSCIAHGLGTYQWLREDVSRRPLMFGYNPSNGVVEASVTDAGQILQNFQFNQDAVGGDFTFREVHAYEFMADLEGTSICLNVQEIGKNDDSSVVVFLHGFLGTGEDWISIMEAISGSARCIAVDLPGHGRSNLLGQDYGLEEPGLSIMAFAKILQQLFDSLQCRKVVLVGYSMGARISLYMALRYNDKVSGAVIISGSPGLIDEEARKVRRAKDDFAACSLASSGLEPFLDAWYSGDLWNSLRTHPHFNKILASRLQHCDLKNLARVLSDLSVGRQPESLALMEKGIKTVGETSMENSPVEMGELQQLMQKDGTFEIYPEDLKSLLFKIDQFFLMENVRNEEKIGVAALQSVGGGHSMALILHGQYFHPATWSEYVIAPDLVERFGNDFHDPMEEI